MVEKIKKQTLADKIFELLQDGEPHHINEIRDKIFDELTSNGAIHVHVHNIRKGLDKETLLICQYIGRALFYRLVRVYNKQ